MEEESYIYINSRSRSASSSDEGQDSSNTYLKQFITTYESFPSLWDPTNPKYSNKVKRNEALDKLAAILRNLKPHATREDARRKVNSLRSNYRKELMKIEKSKRFAASPDEIYNPTSATFHMLKFLSRDDKHGMNQGDSDEYLEEKLDMSTVSSLQYETPPPKIRKSARKSKIEQNKRSIKKELITKVCPVLPTAVESVQPVEAIALVWSEKIKNLSPSHRVHVEKAINDIIYEAEVQHLTQNPMPSVTVYSSLADKSHADLVVGKEEEE